MSATRVPLWKHPEFRVGVRDLAVVAPGLAAWGVMTGVAIVKTGMGPAAVLLMSTIVFAGSSQLAALPLITSGAPMWVIVATAVCVNLRFVVFSLHLRPYVIHQPLWRRLLSGYVMADFGYVAVTTRYPRPPTDASSVAALEAYWAGNGAAGWTSWTVSTLVGVVLGTSVPVEWGLGFAGLLALLGVMASLVSTYLRVVSVGVAAAAAVVAAALPFRLNILVAIVTAVAVCMLAEKATPSHGSASGGA